MPNTKILENEEFVQVMTNLSPALLATICRDIEWMIAQPTKHPKFELKQQGLELWVSDILKAGAKYHRSQMERKIEVKENEAIATEFASNLDNFAKYILSQPGILDDLPKLLQAATPFKVPVDILMGYYTKRQAEKQADAAKSASK